MLINLCTTMTSYKKLFIPASLIIAVFVLLSTGCDPTDKYEKEERAQIQDYINAHPETPFELKASGLYYFNKVEGAGQQPVTHDTVAVIYTGSFLDGEIFGTNVDGDTLVYPANEDNLLPGFEEGVMYIKEGGTALILLSSNLGYGNSGIYFPAYTPTLFEIKLISVIPGPRK